MNVYPVEDGAGERFGWLVPALPQIIYFMVRNAWQDDTVTPSCFIVCDV